jgi:membrane protease YdiL (CAAX protease family)
MVALIAVGEEVGWRGVLQPSMEARYGHVRGTLCVGRIWAYWHLPVNLMGYNDSSHPLLSSLVLFPVALVAISFVLAWLTRTSQSVWPAAFAHGAHNTISPAFLLRANGWAADSTADLVGTLLVAAIVIAEAARARSRLLQTPGSSTAALRQA